MKVDIFVILVMFYERVKQYVEYWKIQKAFRPTPEVLEVYEAHMKMISGRDDPYVLILGVTPELRMLALNHGCRVTAVDFDMVVVSAMSDFMDYTKVDQRKEIILKCDWLTMPLEKHSYDLILADGSFNVLTNLTDYEKLLTKIYELLKPNGYVSTRIGVCPDNWTPTKVIDILKEHRIRVGNFVNVSKSPELTFKMMFSLEAYDEKSSQMSYDKLLEEIRRLFENQKITKNEFDNLLESYSFLRFWKEMTVTLPRKETAEELFMKQFAMISKSKDPKIPPYTYLLKFE
jgi:cyclopropane fatty-acyl-phospholipid synthase-like methyltransferase